ncbi:MAG: HRDC domain-containing protein, partial [Gemmatimonadetes bacterium]|nr:HRDC domain-containing protein [Gemmatimonadota bacterium]
ASELEKIAVVPSSAAHRYGKQLLSAIEAGRQTPKEEWPNVRRAPRRPSDPQAEARYQSLRTLRAERAKAVALDPGLLCPNGTLQAIARAAPRNSHDLDQIAELRSWQRESLGKKAILRAAK